ncbi:MAG: 2-amino-4-oxopentanoate thiolase subunit OrtA [Turicibacter sp.]|nr:2-amino-4-oxopentanoate thiolase subunit OrtA [Turicibacter sp.]
MRSEMMTVKEGSWVLLRKVVLDVGERAEGLPEDTAKVPIVMWIKGFLLEDREIGEIARVRTRMNRVEEGVLEEENPATSVDYGGFVPEILEIGKVREMLNG